jgi:NAD(P)-dependent dehydrogenase (short-subunit alcohol dehydrogenase family)
MASVLITRTSKGIGFEAALAFGGAGPQCPCHDAQTAPHSPELVQTAAREKLPITVFGDGRGLGPVPGARPSSLFNRTTVRRYRASRRGRGASDDGVSRGHGDQLFWSDPLR